MVIVLNLLGRKPNEMKGLASWNRTWCIEQEFRDRGGMSDHVHVLENASEKMSLGSLPLRC